MKRNIIEGLYNDYSGNDLNYDSIKMQAESCVAKMAANGEEISWREVAKNMGFRLETLNYDDLELMRSAIEDAMLEDEEGYEDYEINENCNNMKQKQAIRINESQINSLLKDTLNESYKDRCKIVGMYAFVQFFKLHPEKLQTLEPKWKERYEELSKYFDEHPLNMEMQAIYRREWPQLQGKQTIKLNESQLRNIIKEALNELDWKTYANAARKRAERDKRGGGRNEKVRQLDKAASDALNKKFNMQNHRAQIYTDYDDYSGYGQTGRYPSLGDVADYTDTFYSDFKNPDRDINRIGYPSERSQEMSDYFKGNYDYTPEKGWYLKETKLQRIIKESIKKVLKESTNNPIILGDESDGYLWYVEIGDGGYESTIFNIYAQNEQDALDSAVDYCEQQGWNGLFWDDDEEVTKYEDDFITAGNSGHYLRIDCFIVRRM